MNDTDIYHVLPTDDILEHEEQKYCRCHPRVDVYENGIVIIHKSFDLREPNHPQEN